MPTALNYQVLEEPGKERVSTVTLWTEDVDLVFVAVEQEICVTSVFLEDACVTACSGLCAPVNKDHAWTLS